ncbi:hypothetical protein PsorP6_010647 [Peronosclerospora sorghi]|uniref:Uncharacterized protein n=1 Tax=Peronosclerospora sorghi TaxID=230839 RepID=A0ACC0VV77_9STRA|nr:hypothetical protein PsorP6_010647 [Peronosclerospora sorghi]
MQFHILATIVMALTFPSSWFLWTFLHPAENDPASMPFNVCVSNLSSLTDASSPTHLSIVHTPDRAKEIHLMATNLHNEERSWRIGNDTFPMYMGPVAREGSIAEKLVTQDLIQLLAFRPDTPEQVASVATTWLPRLNSMDSYSRFYEALSPILPPPLESTETSDTVFGASRLSIRGFNLRAITAQDADPSDASLTRDKIATICGPATSLASLRAHKRLFLVDLATLGDFSDDASVHVEGAAASLPVKYVPSVLGYFCFHAAHQTLHPLAIHLVASNLTYTRFDTRAEWQLAKLALNAAEATYQQMHHFSESHTLLIPLRVEVYRTMAASHPVRALVLRHVALDFGLEHEARRVLFNASTPLDQTFGLGARGCLRYLEHSRTRVSILDDVDHDVQMRGIDALPHKYVTYALLHAHAIASFVRAYLAVYYPDADAIQRDVELQAWAAACARIPHLHDFPPAFPDPATLASVLTRLIFQTVVKHHAMNGDVTWTTVAMPFGAPALWKPLPNAKERDGHAPINVFEYVQPRTAFPSLVFLTALFYRPRPSGATLASAYHVAPFSDDPRLEGPIRAYDAALETIEDVIRTNEADEALPYHVLRPSRLALTSWI